MRKKIDIAQVKAFIDAQGLDTKIYIGADSERFKKNDIWYADYTLAVVIHIDGCHLVNIAEIDINNSLKMCKSGTILIMDDTDNIELLNLWLRYSNLYKLLSLYKGNFVDTIFHNIKIYNSSF